MGELGYLVPWPPNKQNFYPFSHICTAKLRDRQTNRLTVAENRQAIITGMTDVLGKDYECSYDI